MSGRNTSGENVLAALIVLGVILIIGLIGTSCEPRCLEANCNRKCASDSSYCYLHEFQHGGHYIYKDSRDDDNSDSWAEEKSENDTSSYIDNSNNSSYKDTTEKNTTIKNETTKKKTYESYDDGYDDIYMDGDYDDDRYNIDKDYADGVDDAMEEYEYEEEF